jgi:hypothetical protein
LAVTDRRTVLGVDLSLSGGLGLCAVPLSWDRDFRRVTFEVIKPTADQPRAMQLSELAGRVVAFVARTGATHCWIEGYTASGRAFGVQHLAEVGGVVRLALLERSNIIAETAPLSSARKLLLGKLPRGKGMAKKTAHKSVEALAGRLLDGNEGDAFVVANYGIAELGEVFIAAAAA